MREATNTTIDTTTNGAASARRAIEDVLTTHRDEFLRFLRRRAPHGVQPDDLLQQGALRAMEHADALRDPTRARAWIYATLRRLLADARAMREVPVAEVPESHDTSPHDEVDASGGCPCATSLMRELKPEYRVALERIELGGESIGAVASDLGISPNNATVRVHRARTALRAKVESHCGVKSAAACLACSCSEHGEGDARCGH